MSRLNPKTTTLRTLFLRSSNQCAFPGCAMELINSYGQYVGNVCHIEAAEEGGERYNPNQTDEDRRAYDNLILLCANHHRITDDVAIYTAPILREMKSNHENKVYGLVVEEAKISAFVNSTHAETVNLPQNLNGIKNKILDYFDQDDLPGLVDHAQIYFSHFKGIPEATRTLFAQILLISESSDHCTTIDIQTVLLYLGVNMEALEGHYRILQRAGLLSELIIDEDEYPARAYRVFTTFDPDDMQAWLLQCIRDHYIETCQQECFVELVSELNFNLMDL